MIIVTMAAHAQFTITPVGVTTGSTMPGSSTDFIFFNGTTYPGYPAYDNNLNNNASDSQLYSFSVSGGVDGFNGLSGYATIKTPAGTSLLTGDVQAAPGIAFALEPGLGTNSDLGTEDTHLNSSFNYNNFDVYLMVSNTNGTLTDQNVALDQREFNGSLNPAFGTTSVSITDNTTGTSSAQFVEFHVTGLGDAIAAGYKPDLVVSANLADGGISYIGGVSFVSLPEPSTYALCLVGLGGLILITRRKFVLG
jgi:hypothetical protein